MSNDENPGLPTRGKAPVFLNGLSSTHTYLCIAVRNGDEEKKAVGVRRLGPNDYKLHFWPNAESFGVALGHQRYGLRHDGGDSMGPYEGSRGDWDHVLDVMTQMEAHEGTQVAPMDKVLEELEKGYTPSRHFTA